MLIKGKREYYVFGTITTRFKVYNFSTIVESDNGDRVSKRTLEKWRNIVKKDVESDKKKYELPKDFCVDDCNVIIKFFHRLDKE